jgi:hypothetical protein
MTAWPSDLSYVAETRAREGITIITSDILALQGTIMRSY